MSKTPKDPKEIFQELTDDYKDCFGNELVSIILYGSAAGKEYRPGKSDINVMVVLTDAGIEAMAHVQTLAGLLNEEEVTRAG